MLNNLGLVLERQGNFPNAELLLLRSLAIKEKKQGRDHPDTAVTLANLARVLDRQVRSGQLAQGTPPAAKPAAGASASPGGAPGAGGAEATQLAARAQTAAAQGDFGQAESLHRQALAVHERQLGPEHPTTLATLTNLGGVMLLQGKFKEAEAVFRRVMVSRSQSRVFSEMLRQADVARFSDAPAFAALKKQRESAQEQSAALRFALLSVAESQADAAAQKAQIGRQLAQSEAALKAAEDQLWRDYPRFMELTNPRAVTADDLQKTLLREGEVLVTFALLPGEAIIFAVTKDKFQMSVARVSREDLTRRVQRLRRPMERIAGGEPLIILREMDPQVLASLYRDLLLPVEPLLKGATKVMVVADGPLYTLPFELMVTRYGNEERNKFEALRAVGTGTADKPFFAEYASLPFAGQAYRFSYLPSLAALSSQRINPKPPATYGRQLVAFADAVFGGEDGSPATYNLQTRALLGVLASTLPGGGARIPRLVETAAEAREVAAIVGGESAVLTRADAQEKRAKSGVLKDARYVLFATHGFLGTDFLQNLDISSDAEGVVARSGTPNKGALAQPALAMTLTGDLQGEDGLLSMREVIEDLELSAELVVLSACNTAGDSQSSNNGEGFAGLTRSFMYAGAKSLVVSHWSVDSVATQALVAGTFREMKTGKGPAEALGSA